MKVKHDRGCSLLSHGREGCDCGAELGITPTKSSMSSPATPAQDVSPKSASGATSGLDFAERAELEHLRQVVNEPCNDDFLKGVSIEAEHQVRRFGQAQDRGKSAESWFWLVGYLAGKCLRACITGDRDKALHHTISAAAALKNWHKAIQRDVTGAGVGADRDVRPSEGLSQE